MHTFKHESGVVIHYHGDYSGNAEIYIPMSGGGVDDNHKAKFVVPCVVLRDFVAEMVRAQRMFEVEHCAPEKLLGLEE